MTAESMLCGTKTEKVVEKKKRRCQARRLDNFLFPLPNDIRASADHVMCQTPTPLGTLHFKCADRTPLLAHYIWNVQTRYVPWHIAYAMCEAPTPFSTFTALNPTGTCSRGRRKYHVDMFFSSGFGALTTSKNSCRHDQNFHGITRGKPRFRSKKVQIRGYENCSCQASGPCFFFLQFLGV